MHQQVTGSNGGSRDRRWQAGGSTRGGGKRGISHWARRAWGGQSRQGSGSGSGSGRWGPKDVKVERVEKGIVGEKGWAGGDKTTGACTESG